MINENETIKRFGYTTNELSSQSHKRIIATCEICKKDREISYYAYRDRCHTCQAIIQAKEMAKISALKRIGTHHKPETIEKMKKSAGRGPAHHSYGTHPSEETRKKLSEAQKGERNGFYGKKHTLETKRKISEAIKRNPTHLGIPASHGKHIDYIRKDGNLIKLRSTWEEKVAKYLDTHDVDWKYESLTLPIIYEYLGERKTGTFTIDFLIQDKNEIWEVKGWWRDDAREKYEAAKNQYKNYNFILLDKIKLKEMKIL